MPQAVLQLHLVLIAQQQKYESHLFPQPKASDDTKKMKMQDITANSTDKQNRNASQWLISQASLAASLLSSPGSDCESMAAAAEATAAATAAAQTATTASAVVFWPFAPIFNGAKQFQPSKLTWSSQRHEHCLQPNQLSAMHGSAFVGLQATRSKRHRFQDPVRASTLPALSTGPRAEVTSSA